MELTKLKRVVNTGEIKPGDFPKYDEGKPEGTGQTENTDQQNTANPGLLSQLGSMPNLVSLGLWAAGGFASGLNSAKKPNELLSDAGTSNMTAGGIGYTAQNYVDPSKVMKEYDNDTLSSAISNPFSTLPRIFGGRNKQEEFIKQANRNAAVGNNFARGNALSQGLQLNAAPDNAASQRQLRGYRDGKNDGWANVSNGEVFVQNGDIIGRVPGIPNFKDGVTAYVGNAGVVSNHKVDGVRNSDYVMLTGDTEGGLMRDMLWRAQHGKSYKNGKLPNYAEGYLGNLIPSSLGMLASIGQYVDAANQDIRVPNVYSANPYESSALNDLAGLKIDQYPIMNQINNATARADAALNMSGGLSGYQRARLRSSNLLNTQNSISNMLMNAQAQNNQYKATLANAKMQLGNQTAQRMQQSNMFREEMAAKSHAARQQGKQMGIYNFLNQLQGYYANEFKRRQFNETMDLYRQQQALDRDRFNAEFPDYGKKSSTTDYKVNTSLTTPHFSYSLIPGGKLGGNIGMYTPPTVTAPKPFYYPGASFNVYSSFWKSPYLIKR